MKIQPCPACGGLEHFSTDDCDGKLLYCCSFSPCGFVCSARYWNYLFLAVQVAEARRISNKIASPFVAEAAIKAEAAYAKEVERGGH